MLYIFLLFASQKIPTFALLFYTFSYFIPTFPKIVVRNSQDARKPGIFAQVNITNPTRWLVKFDVICCYIHLQVNITKQKFSKWRLPVLWKFTDKERSEIQINAVSKNTKACVKILKQFSCS
jgi:hypothetical protein